MKTSFKNLTAAFLIVIAVYSCKREITSPAITIQSITEDASLTLNNAVFKDLVYGRNKDWLGVDQDLTLDLYLCTPAVNKQKFPIVIFIHGGGFITGDKEYSQSECELLNSSGFIAATINYRLGREVDANICKSNIQQTSEASYRAIQDLRASIRYLVANADKYGINTNQIFIEGSSAGAATCLEAAYIIQDSADFYFPGASTKLGKLNNADNNLQNKYIIRGIASMWGALHSQYIINRTNAIPTIFFHGQLDDVIPWDIGHFNNCINFPVDFGTKPLYDRLSSFGISSVAYIDPTGGHGVYKMQFLQQQTASFFKGIIYNYPAHGIYFTKSIQVDLY